MKKKIDSRIQTLINNGINSHRRTMLVLVGDRARYQIVNFHYILSKNAERIKPKVLWCYKSELQFSSHQKKRMKQVKNMQVKGLYDANVDDPFDLFISSTQIRYTYYKESHKILGNTYQMLILQDFQALSPNLLCRTIQTVQGGGIIIFLLKTMTSLKQLYSLTMDVHQRYRTDAFQDIEPRFNQRFLLSLSKNNSSIIMDDQLNILPISSHIAQIKPIQAEEFLNKKAKFQLDQLKKSLSTTDIIGSLISLTKTLDQAKTIMIFVDTLRNTNQSSICSLTAPRGRGKSAAIGLAISAAIKLGYSNIFVSAPSPENLKTLFQFVCFGLQSLDYKQRLQFQKKYSSSKQYEKSILKIEIFKTHSQFVQFVFPNDADKIGHTDLMIVDQAAAIPLPYVKSFLGSPKFIMSSTINGYEGTGRSLSLKLIEDIKQSMYKTSEGLQSGKKFLQITMTDPIRYAFNDEIQNWLNDLLLLNATEPTPLKHGQRLPHPNQCGLYLINRDTLFSYKTTSEKFLFSLMSLFISSHYKNSPNDLQLLSDSPSHLVFVLLGPLHKTTEGKAQMPDILCAIQLALQGKISSNSISVNSQRGYKPSGDLVPWVMREQFQDDQFPKLAGGRIVRIATHSKVFKMGYGSKALQLLCDFFQNKLISLDPNAQIKDYDFKGNEVKQPLLKKLEEIRPPKLHYLATSFGFTNILIKFWRKNGFQPVYLRQSLNDITAEHSGIMLKALENTSYTINVNDYVSDFKRRFMNLLGFQFRKLGVGLALQILTQTKKHESNESSSRLINLKNLKLLINEHDCARLKAYSKNQADYHLILDLIPTLSQMYFKHELGIMNMGYINQAILVGLGLQHKTIEEICKQNKDLEVRNALPLLQKTIIKFKKIIQQIYEKQIEDTLPKISKMKDNLSLGNQLQKTKRFGLEQVRKIEEEQNQLENFDNEEIDKSKRIIIDSRQQGKKTKKKLKKY